MPQLVTRVDVDLLRELDALVEAGSVESRSEGVRAALAMWIRTLRRQAVDEQIVAAYLRQPQTEREIGWTDAAARLMIEEEPW